MHVVVWTPHPEPARLISPTQRFVDLQDLVAQADVVSLHLMLTDDTRGMLDERLLRTLKPGALLVNTARAELIAPGALERVLAEGRIAAALDVFESEPLAAGSPSATCPTSSSPRTRATTPRRAWSACSTWSSPTSSATSPAPQSTSSKPPGNYLPLAIPCHSTNGLAAIICHH